MTLAIIPRLISVNFAKGRKAVIDMVTVHVTEGSADSVVQWFNNPAAVASAHYMVRADGARVQFVREEDTAWHAGRVDHPTAPLVLARPSVNPNAFSIGIEHEGDGKHELTAAQRTASVALIADICERYNIMPDRTHIVGHHEIYSLKTCPGAIDVDRLVRDVALSMGMTVTFPPPRAPVAPSASAIVPVQIPDVVYSAQLGAIVPISVTSDNAWSFARVVDIRAAIAAGKVPPTLLAGTLLSQMPRKPL
jgi:hypothetical protein